MPIGVQCSGCGGKFRAPDEAAGEPVKCPKCGTAIVVPSTGHAKVPTPTLPQPKEAIGRSRNLESTDQTPVFEEVVCLIRKWRKNLGWSPGKIAEELNHQGHHTKTGSSWREQDVKAFFVGEGKELLTRGCLRDFLLVASLGIFVILLACGAVGLIGVSWGWKGIEYTWFAVISLCILGSIIAFARGLPRFDSGGRLANRLILTVGIGAIGYLIIHGLWDRDLARKYPDWCQYRIRAVGARAISEEDRNKCVQGIKELENVREVTWTIIPSENTSTVRVYFATGFSKMATERQIETYHRIERTIKETLPDVTLQ